MLKRASGLNVRFLLLLLGAVFVFYLSWSLIIPFGEAPDEILRFDIVRFIAQHHRLPVAGEPGLDYGGYGVTYAAMPIFSYIVSAVFCMPVLLLHLPVRLYLAARLVSVLSGVVAVGFVGLTAAKLYPTSFARYFVPIFFAFLPQFSFVSAYVNQDSFMIMLSAAILYLWLRGLETNWDVKTVVWLGVTMGLMLLTYLNGYTLIVSTLFVVLVSYRRVPSRGFFLKCALCAGIVLAVAGWFFVRNAWLYHGDLLGLKITDSIARQRAMPGFSPDDLVRRIDSFRNLKGVLFWLALTFLSFWAYFENLTIHLHVVYYVFIALLCLIAAAGLFVRLREKAARGVKAVLENRFAWGLFITLLFAFGLHVYYSFWCDYQPQGRYMFPAIIPVVLLMTAGFERILPARLRTLFYKAAGAAFILVDLYCAYSLLFQRYLIDKVIL